jgi:hypothetical protein
VHAEVPKVLALETTIHPKVVSLLDVNVPVVETLPATAKDVRDVVSMVTSPDTAVTVAPTIFNVSVFLTLVPLLSI